MSPRLIEDAAAALDPQPPRRRPGLFGRLRSSFLTGLVVIAPIGLTIWLIWTVIGWIDGFVLPLIPHPYRPNDWLIQHIGVNLRGVGVVIFLVFTVVVGWVAKGLIGKQLLKFAESMVDRMPVVRSVYNGLKQIAETVFAQSESNFDKACLIQYPRKGLWAVGFVSTTTKGEIARRVPTEDRMISVFLPTTPNPTSGFLLFVPESELIYLDMQVEDAAKLVISAGLVYPADRLPPELAAARGADPAPAGQIAPTPERMHDA
ncbi:hypothetical protein CBW24_10795 [Pacificitalea manganoxidans]|uniref:DUF502 domain-containing protein n=1 Tax=Pacificitalea manganoxidans TaxID=1411902 RepID=A0A291M0L7_9RHOB|nr:DUF502 domain-containing protein [Pacificitalea manganoxidans]ATI42444.1 hypothetical protein CBW24_10795 [Pacificitalea manganoxidans]MAQ46562.1 DUF502 domain-containing protein [Actibacterium sp.]MDR6307702.1 putative membrane protein [Pacificitalea manganoxidans]